jgi:hypothetical protein
MPLNRLVDDQSGSTSKSAQSQKDTRNSAHDKKITCAKPILRHNEIEIQFQ